MAEPSRARRRTGKDARTVIHSSLVFIRDLFDTCVRATPTEHGDCPAAAAARDLSSIKPLLVSGRTNEFDQQISSRRTQPTRRIAGVRHVHQIAQRYELAFGLSRP